MRMFQSVHGTAASKIQLTTAHSQLYRSWKVSPTLFQTDMRITDHREHEFPPSLTLLPVQNSNRMASRLTAIASFPSVFFNSCNTQGTSKLFGSLGWSNDINWLDFSSILLKNVDFAAQFFLRCKFSFHEKRHSSQVWQWRDLPKPITILCQRTATNEIALFCIDHRWRQMAFFRIFKMGSAPLSPALREIKQFYAYKI